MSKQILEAALLFILLLNFFRSFVVLNHVVIILAGIGLFAFLALSLPNFSKKAKAQKIRTLSFWFVIAVVYVFLLREQIVYRINRPDVALIHDGGVQTEFAASSLVKGRNPYSITYDEVLKGERFYHQGRPHPVLNHFAYSPLTFLVSIPVQLVTGFLFNISDVRIALFIFFIMTATIGAKIVGEKMLFLILFLFNPLFVHSLFLGANDAFVLFFLFASIAALYLNRTTLATVSLALAAGTKLTVFPFIPLYFIYLFVSLRRRKGLSQMLLRQFVLFLVINLVIYLPFFLWDANALIDDLVLFPLKGGEQAFPITGILGVPQLLTSIGKISAWTTFPFYLIQPLIIFPFLVMVYRLFKKTLQLSALCILYVLLFILSFSFSTVFNPNYLDYLSQVIVLGSFIRKG